MTMAKPLEYFQWFADLFDEQVEHLPEHPSLEDRIQLLRLWKIRKLMEQRVRQESLGLNADSCTHGQGHSAPDHNPTS